MEKTTSHPESADDLMTTRVPTANTTSSVSDIIQLISKGGWEDAHFIYVLEGKTLVGMVTVAKLLSSPGNEKLEKLMIKPKVVVKGETDQEKVVMEAVKNDLEYVPVVDGEGYFLGVVTAEKIIDVLHMEHLEDFLRFSGIRGKGSLVNKLLIARFLDLVKLRLPWLVVGLSVALLVSIISSKFEVSLRQNIALVFFIPVIGYISDAVGTQTETLLIRTLTLFKFNFFSYLLRELLIGVVIGVVIGIFTAVFGFFLSGSAPIAVVVGISLFLSISIATVLACLTPAILNSLGKDPAVGSGPFTTAIQYVVSLTIYFMVAAVIL